MKIKLTLFGRFLVGAGLCFGLIVLSGCKGAQIASGPATTQQTTKNPVQAAAKEEDDNPRDKKLAWSYDPTDKRDPFQEPIEQTVGGIDHNPLTLFNLDQMWIDAIIVGGGRDLAHVILPDSSDWFIKVNDELGVNHGHVKQILPDGIVVEEQYLDPVDNSKIRIVEKSLKMEPLSLTAPLMRR